MRKMRRSHLCPRYSAQSKILVDQQFWTAETEKAYNFNRTDRRLHNGRQSVRQSGILELVEHSTSRQSRFLATVRAHAHTNAHSRTHALLERGTVAIKRDKRGASHAQRTHRVDQVRACPGGHPSYFVSTGHLAQHFFSFAFAGWFHKIVRKLEGLLLVPSHATLSGSDFCHIGIKFSWCGLAVPTHL